MDVSSLPNVSLGASKYWVRIVDDATKYKWSYFVCAKDELAQEVECFINKKLNKHEVKYLRCDHAGENKKLLEICDKYGIKIEYTAPHTPQHSGVVERRFAVVRQRAVAMMHNIKINEDLKKLIWAEALNTSTTLVNITVSSSNEMRSSHSLMYGSHVPKYLST